MTVLQLPFHSYRLRSTPASTARLVNCISEALPPDAKTPTVLSRVPGIYPFLDLGNGPIRGMHAFQGDLFVVSGTELYKVTAAATSQLVGSIPGTGLVSMAHNPDYLIIVSEPNGYYSDGVTVSPITDPDFTARGAKSVRFSENFMVFIEPNTGRIFWAEVGSATNFDSLDFSTAEGNPDILVGMEADHTQLVLLGTESGEIFANNGNGFERAINGFFELGCFNGNTIAKLDNSVYWVANDYTVRRLEGATPVRKSTPAVEQFLSSVDVSTLRAYSYDQDGHFFYVLCCSSGCFVYDVASGEWAERSTYPYDYFVWQVHAYAHGRQYVGDTSDRHLGYFSPTHYKEGLNGIQRMEATFQPIYAENRLARHLRLEIVLETGVGLVTGQGSDPEIMASYSDDGGITWTNLPNRKLGKMGEYRHRVWWSGLGSSRQRVYRIAISDPIKVAITQAIVDVEGGRL